MKTEKSQFFNKAIFRITYFFTTYILEELLFIATLPFHSQTSQYQLRAVKVGEFFLAYLLLL